MDESEVRRRLREDAEAAAAPGESATVSLAHVQSAGWKAAVAFLRAGSMTCAIGVDGQKTLDDVLSDLSARIAARSATAEDVGTSPR